MSAGGLYAREGGEFVANTAVSGDQRTPSVVALASGGYVVVWNDDGTNQGICAQLFDASGNKVGGEIDVNAVATSNPGAVIALSSGGFAVAWGDPANPNTTTRLQVFDSTGAKVGGEVTTAFYPGDLEGAGLGGNQFVLVNATGAGQIFAGSGAPVGAAFQLPNTAGFAFADVAALSGGGFVAVGRTTAFKVGVQRYDATGTMVGSQIVFDDPFNSPTNFSISGLSNGGFAISWTSADTGRIHMRSYDAAGNAASPVVSYLATGSTSGGDPTVTGLSDDQFLLVWQSELGSTDVRGQVFDATGQALGTDFLVSAGSNFGLRNHGEPDAALLASGDVVTVWSGAGPGDPWIPGPTPPDHGIRGQIFTPLTSALTIQLTPSTSNVNEASTDDLAALLLTGSSNAVNASYQYQLLSDGTGGGFVLDGGRLMIADNDFLDAEYAPGPTLTIRVTDNAGNTVDKAIALTIVDDLIERRYSAGTESQASTELTWPQIDPAIAALDTGGFVVVWTHYGHTGDGTGSAIYAQLHDAAGAKIGVPFLVNTWTSSIQETPSVTALVGGGFVVVWSSAPASFDYDIRAQIYQSDGSKVGGELAVNNETNAWQEAPVVAALASGGFAVAWSQTSETGGDPLGRTVRLQLYDSSGAEVGPERLVNTNDAGDQLGPAIAMMPDGTLIVTWTDSSGVGGDASATSIKAQRFDAAGAPLGGEFLVNTTTSGAQSVSSVAAIDDGFVVTWQSAFTIKAQVFDLAGQKVGSEIAVSGFGTAPFVAALPGDGFAVAWSGNDPSMGDSSGTATMMQAFDASGLPTGALQAINGATANSQTAPVLTVLEDGTLAAAWVDSSRSSGSSDIKARLFEPQQAEIYGTGGAETLAAPVGGAFVFGGGGNDRLEGGPGGDTLVGGNGNDVLIAGLGTDTLVGGAGNDSLGGGTDNDSLDGGTGDDAMTGGAGNDVYFVDSIGDSIIELSGEGTDEIRTALAAYSLAGLADVESLTGLGSAGQTLTGNGSNNLIDGGLGADAMAAGFGNDTYFVDNSGDVVTENAGQGTDEIRTSLLSYSLAALANIENLTGLGSAGQTLTGNGLDNVIDGGGGADSMDGGAGNDTYIVDNVGDTVFDSGGTDHVKSSITYALAAGIERLTLTGAADLNGTGNELANALTGNSGNNTLDGGAEADTLTGGAGDDTFVVDNAGDTLIELAGGGSDAVRSSLTWTLGAQFETLTLTGSATITGTGNALANVLNGNSAANVLNGGAGADQMFGGVGNDTYVVDNAGDRATEVNAGHGTDTVLSSVTFQIASHVENLTLTGSAAIDARGNDLANVLTGNAAANSLWGYGGADTMIGGAGNDSYYVDAGDVVQELAGGGIDTVLSELNYTLGAQLENLTLTGGALNGNGNGLDNVIVGNALANTLTGGAGADTLNGGTGADLMYGGEGNDTYVVDNTGDRALEGNAAWGIDTVLSSITHTLAAKVEHLTLTGVAAIDGRGNELDNVITGNAANNSLWGGLGADTLRGGAGNDSYYVDAGDVVQELAGGGLDTVLSDLDYTLGSQVENLTLTGGAVNGTGNGLANAIVGNGLANTLNGGAGNDTLNGGTGADLMYGGDGDDTYVIDNTGDRALEGNAAWGTDSVLSSITHTLAAKVENLTLTGTAAINGRGTDQANAITGNSANNSLWGGLGADTLAGGGGNDTFLYTAVAESTAASRDTITTFNLGDKIDLATIDANSGAGGNQAFAFVGASAFTGVAGELRATQSGSDWLIEADVNGDSLADLTIGLTTQGGHILGAGDFVL